MIINPKLDFNYIVCVHIFYSAHFKKPVSKLNATSDIKITKSSDGKFKCFEHRKETVFREYFLLILRQ